MDVATPPPPSASKVFSHSSEWLKQKVRGPRGSICRVEWEASLRVPWIGVARSMLNP
jgi:hypothetical protein